MKKLLAEYDVRRNVELFEELVTEPEPIGTFEDLQRWSTPFGASGCFRGHREASWSLVTTLDRVLLKTVAVEHISETRKVNPAENERKVLLEFQRGATEHLTVTPALDSVVDWLALMQHHGAPTRLLDWTRSPYVGLFFAIQEDSGREAALWAIDLKWFEQRSHELLRQHYKDWPDASNFGASCRYMNEILFRDDNPYIIVSASPTQLNERMLAQQGQLLCSLRHDVGFSSNLLGMLVHPSIVERQVVSKAVVKREERINFLEELRRMNVHSASLFPGLDGFARSVAVNLDISVAHQVEDLKQAKMETIREFRLKYSQEK